MPLIAYYRVSTAEQKMSGLGLEAQAEAVRRYAAATGQTIRAEFSETMSSSLERPDFDAAVAMATAYGDTLTVARLDRLTRDLHTLTKLQTSGVQLLAVDMPGAEKVMTQIMGALAEYERDTIRARTKAALAAKKARGDKLGAPAPAENVAEFNHDRAATVEEFRSELRPRLRELRQSGATLAAIAAQLNADKVPTPSGTGSWKPVMVSRALQVPRGLKNGQADETPPPSPLPLFEGANQL